MSKKGKGSTGTATSSIAETFVPVIPPTSGDDPSFLPFPEWTDQGLNAEKWDKPKVKGPTPTGETSELFEDPQIVRFPSSLTVCSWKRPGDIFPDAKLVMFVEKPEYPDLISANKHLLHSDLVRAFISAIIGLEFLGNSSPFPIEYTTVTFTPTTQDIPWRPWHLIYSMCKAGKGQKHNPQVNQLGKYVVRLFWMGSWRKITIDDKLPVGIGGLIQLPGFKQPDDDKGPPPIVVKPITPPPTPVKGSKSPKSPPPPPPAIIEIWPYLLFKALLKIASLTWTEKNEMVDFDIVHCLTGWVLVKNDLRGMNFRDKWDMCTGFTNHYSWDSEQQRKINKGKKDKPKGKGKGKGKGKDKSPKSSKQSKSGKSSRSMLTEDEDEEDLGVPCHMFLTCANMRFFDDDKAPNLSPCWSHHILIDQTRMIPLIKPKLQPELEKWKNWRWIEWASKKGIYDLPEDFGLIKYVKFVSAFKKVSDHFIPSPVSIESIEIKIPETVREEKGKKGKDKGKGKGKGKEKDEKKSSAKSKSDKTSKSSTKEKKGKGKEKFEAPPDPSIWGDFFKLWEFMDTMLLYFKPSRFVTNYRISDLAASGVAKDVGKKDKKDKKGKAANETSPTTYLIWRNEILPSRNNPLYIFMDSLDYKLFIMNLVQTGDISLLDPCFEENSCRSVIPFASVILEEFDWREETFGKVTAFVNTTGLSSSLTNINKGRHLFRLWLRNDTSFILNLLSDVLAVIGTWERVQHFMQGESECFTKLCHGVSSAYGQLVQKFGTEVYPNGLRTFYSSYLPDKPLLKSKSAKVHDKIMAEIVKTLKETYTGLDFQKAIFALKVLFLNPYIIPRSVVLEEPQPICPTGEYSSLSFVFAINKKVETAATRIQAFFKRVFVNKLQAYHNQTHKNYMPIFLTLKKIYTDLFSISKRFVFCSPILRNLLFETNNNDWSQSYSLYKDLLSVVHSQGITGVSVCQNNVEWIYLTRVTFHCDSPDPVLIKIQLFSLLPHFMVRVFDNDTDKELYRFTNNVNVQNYANNAYGYTALCYGWPEICEPQTWKLCLISIKKKEKSLIILSDLKPELNAMHGVYIPNYANRIFRCKIDIQQNTLVSFRLTVSRPTAKITLKLLDDTNKVLGEVTNVGNAIYPAKLLTYNFPYESGSVISVLSNVTQRKKSGKSGSSKSVTYLFPKKDKKKNVTITSESITTVYESYYTTYFVEGFVLEDSWILTEEEWVVADEAKKAKYIANEIPAVMETEGSTSSKAVSRKGSRGKSLTSGEFSKAYGLAAIPPFWLLQFVFEEPETVMISVDKSRDEEIMAIKKSWFTDDPERAARGAFLRANFLMALEMESGESDFGDHDDIDVFDYLKTRKKLRTKETASEIFRDYIEPKEISITDVESEESKVLMSEEMIADFLEQNKRDMENFEEIQKGYESDLMYLTLDYQNRRQFTNIWLEAVKTESMELIKDALTIRQRYIEWLIKEEESKIPPSKLPTETGKQDKGKKGKGKKKK